MDFWLSSILAALPQLLAVLLGSALSVLSGFFSAKWSLSLENKKLQQSLRMKEYFEAIDTVQKMRNALEDIRMNTAGYDGTDKEADGRATFAFETAYALGQTEFKTLQFKLRIVGGARVGDAIDKLGGRVEDYFETVNERMHHSDNRFLEEEYDEMLGDFDRLTKDLVNNMECDA